MKKKPSPSRAASAITDPLKRDATAGLVLPITVRHAKGKQTRTLFDGNQKPVATIKHVPNVKNGTQIRAQEIAPAVNERETLRKALEEAKELLDDVASVGIPGSTLDMEWCKQRDDLVAKIDAALTTPEKSHD